MRYIFLMMMLTGMLFSAQQRQIILGSFSVESNALFSSIDVQKKVDEDYRLKAMIDKYNLKVQYKKVGAYNVVTIYPFDDYASLFETIDAVKHYYPESYAINYPAFASQVSEEQSEVEPAVESEPLLAKEPEAEELAVEAEVVEEPEVMPVTQEEIRYEAPVVNKPVLLPAPVVAQEESLPIMDMILLIALLVVIIGFFVYKRKMTAKEEE